MHHISLKIAAFLFAITLWFFVVSGKQYEITREIPLELINIPENLALVNSTTPSVKVLIKGSGRELIQYKHRFGKIIVDISNAKLGSNQIILRPQYFKNSQNANIKVSAILNPRRVDAKFDTRISKEIPIRNHVQIQIAPDFTLVGKTSLSPEKIRVSGARNWLTRVFEAQTQELELKNLSSDTVLNVQIKLPENHPVRLDQSEVKLKVTVQELSSRTFENIPVRLLSRPEDSLYQLEPNKTRITLTGGKQILESIQPKDITIFIEFTRFIIEGKKSLSPTVNILDEVKSWRLEPNQFTLKSISSSQIQKELP